MHLELALTVRRITPRVCRSMGVPNEVAIHFLSQNCLNIIYFQSLWEIFIIKETHLWGTTSWHKPNHRLAANARMIHSLELHSVQIYMLGTMSSPSWVRHSSISVMFNVQSMVAEQCDVTEHPTSTRKNPVRVRTEVNVFVGAPIRLSPCCVDWSVEEDLT